MKKTRYFTLFTFILSLGVGAGELEGVSQGQLVGRYLIQPDFYDDLLSQTRGNNKLMSEAGAAALAFLIFGLNLDLKADGTFVQSMDMGLMYSTLEISPPVGVDLEKEAVERGDWCIDNEHDKIVLSFGNGENKLEFKVRSIWKENAPDLEMIVDRMEEGEPDYKNERSKLVRIAQPIPKSKTMCELDEVC